MDTVVLGRTGVEVSVAGLGCGGHSRLGQRNGATVDESVALVRRAMELGITFIDTARLYGTEEIVGKAVAGHRDEVVISTKAQPVGRGGPLGAADLRSSLEKSLGRLGTDHVDVFHLHGVAHDEYDHCVDELVPEMERMREAGMLRFLAISEVFGQDSGHVMLQRAVKDPWWDVMMVGFHLLNPTARDRVFSVTQDAAVAVLVMFAVRKVLSQPDELARTIADLVAAGHLPEGELDPADPLGFLVHDGGAGSVVEAAYRFARHEPGTTVVLTGTGSQEHLEQNVRSINLPPLPDADLARLRRLFGTLDVVTGN